MDKTPYTDIIELVLALMKSYELDSIYDDAIQNSEDNDDSSGDKAMILFFLPYFKYTTLGVFPLLVMIKSSLFTKN